MTSLGYAVRVAGTTAVTDKVDELLRDAHRCAGELLAEHRAFLTLLAAELLEEETLSLADITAVAARVGVRPSVAIACRPRASGAGPRRVVVPLPVPAPPRVGCSASSPRRCVAAGATARRRPRSPDLR